MGKLYRRPDSPFWWAWWQDAGGTTQRASTRSGDRRVATLFLSAREAEVIRAGAGVPTARRIALADAVGQYLAEHRPPIWSAAWWYGVNKWWHARLIDDLGGPERIVSDVTREDVANARARWLTSGDDLRAVKPPTVNRLLSVGSGFYRWAIERGIALANPFALQKRHAEERVEVPTLDEDTLDRLLAAIEWPPLRRWMTVLVDTALRPSELRRARIEDLRETWLEVVSSYARGHTKTSRPRRVPLTPRAQEALRESIGERKEGQIFEHRPDHREKLGAACKAIGIRRLRLYDLRHLALTRAANAGAHGHELSRLAGWRSMAMADRYIHPDDARVEAVIGRLGQRAPAVKPARARTGKDTHKRRTKLDVTDRND